MDWTQFLFSYAVSTILNIIPLTLKNPAQKAKYFAALRKVVLSILAAYPELLNDPAVTKLKA